MIGACTWVKENEATVEMLSKSSLDTVSPLIPREPAAAAATAAARGVSTGND
jgi:hypothetical protein